MWSPEQKRAWWGLVDRTAQTHERAFSRMAATQFNQDMRGGLAIVQGAKKKSLQEKATPNYLTLIELLYRYFHTDRVNGWRQAFGPLIQMLIRAQAGKIETVLGVAFDLPNVFALDWFIDYTLEFAKRVTKTTSDTLQTMLLQAQAEGWSIDTSSKRIEQLFRQWIDDGPVAPEDFAWLKERLPLHRREAIARTETMHASNAGSFELYRHARVPKKEWLATGDDRTRPSHAAANGQVVAVDSPFIVGGYQMMYPLDGSLGAPLEEIVNCFIDPQVNILTNNGWVQIKDIDIGNKVLTHKGRFQRVVRLGAPITYSGDVVKVGVDVFNSGSRMTYVTVTPEHPILMSNGWKRAEEIRVGEIVYWMGLPCAMCGKPEAQYVLMPVRVAEVSRWTLRKPRRLWNFAVENDESYIAKGFVVHNCRCTPLPVIEESTILPVLEGEGMPVITQEER